MEETKKINKDPQSILDEILEKTFQKLENNEEFDPELILELQKLDANLSEENLLISILRGESW